MLLWSNIFGVPQAATATTLFVLSFCLSDETMGILYSKSLCAMIVAFTFRHAQFSLLNVHAESMGTWLGFFFCWPIKRVHHFFWVGCGKNWAKGWGSINSTVTTDKSVLATTTQRQFLQEIAIRNWL